MRRRSIHRQLSVLLLFAGAGVTSAAPETVRETIFFPVTKVTPEEGKVRTARC